MGPSASSGGVSIGPGGRAGEGRRGRHSATPSARVSYPTLFPAGEETMAATSPRRKKPTRTIRLVRSPEADGVGVFCVTVGASTAYYTCREIPCEIGGRGFAVHRTGLGTLYHVRVGGPED